MASFCFITDSLGMDAAVGQPEENPISYIRLLEGEYERKFGERVTVVNDSITGRTSEMLLALLDKYDWKSFRKIFIQVGIVDCSPRVLTAFQRKMVSRIRPIFLRNNVIKLIGRLHTRWFFKYFPYPVLVSMDRFEKSLISFITNLRKTNGAAEIYLIGIAPTTDAKEYVYVGISEKIISYNNILKKVSGDKGVVYIDIYKEAFEKRNELLYDGVHFTKKGKELLMATIFKSIAQ